MHTYIHTYMHTYIHTCIHTCIHTYIHVLILESKYTFINNYFTFGILNTILMSVQ